MQTIWEDVKAQVRNMVPEKTFSLWVDPIRFMDQKENDLVLGCPNKFFKNWIVENYLPLMEEKLFEIDRKYRFQLKILPREKRSPDRVIKEDNKQLAFPNMPLKKKNGHLKLNSQYTFNRFVVGECNQFAYSVSSALGHGDDWPYNSLFLLSGTGLGKSHLSQAIGHAIHERSPQIKVHYITAEDFINEMVFSLRHNQIEEFKTRYRKSCDVLLLEEIHFLSGKEKTQMELGYTLDALINDNKKIIFTSALLPKDIPSITKELASRLTSGIITRLEKPDYQTRVKIIKKKAEEHNLPLSDEIIYFLAKQLVRDIRQMESALRCLRAKAEFLKEKIDLTLAREVIKCYSPEQESLDMDGIRKLVCQYYKVDEAVLCSKSRKKNHAFPRNVYAYLCRHFTEATLEDIGQSIERNHSTVLYASEVIEKKMNQDRKVKNQIDFLTQKVQGKA